MRTTFTFAASLLLASAWGQHTEQRIASQVKEVTVFLSGAQVKRTASLEVRPGTTTWVITGLSPRINEQSIQVQTGQLVKLLAVSFRINYAEQLKKPDPITILEKEKTRLSNLMAVERGKQEVLREEEVMLKANKELRGQYQGVNINDLKVAVDYFRNRYTDIKQKQQEADVQLAMYTEEMGMVESQLAELKNRKAQPTGEIVIRTTSRQGARDTLHLSYLVQEARWYPSYDIRAVDINSPLSVTYKANVAQQSGEDWERVKLVMSTANPSVTGAKPILQAWHLGFNNALAARSSVFTSDLVTNRNEVRGRVTSAEDGSPLPGVNIVIKGTTVGTVTDANGEYTIPLTANAASLVFSFIGLQTQEVPVGSRSQVDVNMALDVTQLHEVVVTGFSGYDGYSSAYGTGYQPKVKKTIVATPVVRQTNVEYVVDEPYTILSDGEFRSVEMIEYEMEAQYQYYSVPKLDADAFLIARLVNWDEYNLLEGEASLFFEGKYVGKSILDTRNTSDTLSLSLGRDPNVIVTREKVKDFSTNQVIGGNRKMLFAYEIMIRNKKQQDIDIRIEDQVPVANTKEIAVDKLEDSNGEFNPDTGLLVWNRKIGSGKTDKLELKYMVKFPRYAQVILE